MINRINFLGQIHQVQHKKNEHFQTKPIENDCFVRSTNATVENDFINWANKNNFIQKSLATSLSRENLLGKGFTNAVYKIQNNDNYVLRLRRSEKNLSNIDFSDYKLYDTRDLNLKENFGQCIAEIRSDDHNKPIIQVLRKQNGIANGNPPPTAIYYENGDIREGELHYESRERKEHYAQCLQILADMPQSAYDDVARKISQIGKFGYKFDYYNSNNFMLDEAGGQINIIDLDKISKEYKNDHGSALWALSNIEYLNTFLSTSDGVTMSEEEKNRAFDNTVTIIDKYTKALQNNGLKYSTKSIGFYTQLLDSMPMSFYLRTMNFEEKSRKLADMGVLEY